MENNFVLTGDEARLLMVTMASSEVNVPASMTINLWNRLNAISHAQPPTEINAE